MKTIDGKEFVYYSYVAEGEAVANKSLNVTESVIRGLKDIAKGYDNAGTKWYIYRRVMDLLFESRGTHPNVEFILTNTIMKDPRHPLGKYELFTEFDTNTPNLI